MGLLPLTYLMLWCLEFMVKNRCLIKSYWMKYPFYKETMTKADDKEERESSLEYEV